MAENYGFFIYTLYKSQSHFLLLTLYYLIFIVICKLGIIYRNQNCNIWCSNFPQNFSNAKSVWQQNNWISTQLGNYLCELSAKYKKAKYAFIFLKINCKLEKNWIMQTFSLFIFEFEKNSLHFCKWARMQKWSSKLFLQLYHQDEVTIAFPWTFFSVSDSIMQATCFHKKNSKSNTFCLWPASYIISKLEDFYNLHKWQKRFRTNVIVNPKTSKMAVVSTFAIY